MTIYGYMRVSTEDQNHNLQFDALVASGIEPKNIFKDTISGKTTERPELGKLLESLQRGDTLTVWKLDRLGRSLGHLILLLEGLNAEGVAFRSLTESLDTATPMGKCMFHIIGAFAQMEREVNSQRTREGLKASKARGRSLGRPPISPEQRSEILKLHRLKQWSLRKIAAKVGVSAGAVQNAILRDRNPAPAPPPQTNAPARPVGEFI